MSKLYLAYGSNLNKMQMAYRCPTATKVGTTYLEGYKLLFRGGYGSAVATIEPSKKDKVPVGIWEIQDRDERALDRYEGFPRLYRKEMVSVELNGEQTEVMVYIMNKGYKLNPPSQYYYKVIEEGYADFDIDTKYLTDALKRSR